MMKLSDNRCLRYIMSSLLFCIAATPSFARSFEFKLSSSGGKSEQKYFIFQDKEKRLFADLKIGRPGPKDSPEPLEIKAASVFKEIKTKATFVNDIATLKMVLTNSVNTSFAISSGTAKRTDDKWKDIGYDMSKGYHVVGFIVEIWQDGKCLKHLTNLPGGDGADRLDKVTPSLICKDGYKAFSKDAFDNATQIALVK